MSNTTPKMGKLSNEIKGLVNEGVYSMYTVRDGKAGNRYALFTDKGEAYLLSEDGEVLQNKIDTRKLTLGESIRFPGESTRPWNVNYKIG